MSSKTKGLIRFLKKHYAHYATRKKFEKKNRVAHDFLRLRPQPELTAEEIREIDAYWLQFGIKFQDYSWFRWFYGVNGERTPKYIPNDVYAHIVWPYYNRIIGSSNDFVLAWRDKNSFGQLLPGVTFPKTIIHKVKGRYYDSDWNYVEALPEKLYSTLSRYGEVIVKDALDTGEGRGVERVTISSVDDVAHIMESRKSDNYLFQEVVKQHEFFSQFNKDSVNLMRINTWRHGDRVEVLSPVLRFGMPGHATDVCFIDGKEIVRGVGITLDGCLKDTVLSLDGEKTPLDAIVKNPAVKVPSWDRVIKMITENAKKLHYFDIIGWDVTVSEEGNPVCLEYNIQRPSVVFCQPNNGPFFGNFTDDVLAFLKNEKNRCKYIPKWMRSR